MPSAIVISAGLAACIAAGLAAVFLIRAPRLSFVVWILSVFFLPVWVGVNVGFFMSAITLLTVLFVALHSGRFRLSGPDAFMLLFTGLVVLLFAAKQVELTYAVSGILELVLPYFWGRIVYERVGSATVTAWVAGVAVGVAALAIVEFVTGTNLFVAIPGSEPLKETWAELQPRAGFVRVEGAFGHSIALGGALAMSAAFVLASRAKAWMKALGLAIVGLAVVLTFSRIGIVTFVLTVVLSLILLRTVSASTRWAVGGLLIVAAAILVPFLDTVFADAGGEAGGSADYRGGLTVLLSQVRLIGGASEWESLVVGDVYLGNFRASIDNAFIALLLRYGYLPTAALFAVYAAAVVLAVRSRALSPGLVAIVAQVPGLFAVAFITQYGILLWFIVGVTVGQITASGRPTSSDEAPRPKFMIMDGAALGTSAKGRRSVATSGK
ncbi:hypothetical protein AB0P19_12010 [Microbacterium oleivorans]|uniref:hypothetical protein n=1 Tax=Microbacterium TaxID=33882 RepID=UPI0033E7734B